LPSSTTYSTLPFSEALYRRVNAAGIDPNATRYPNPLPRSFIIMVFLWWIIVGLIAGFLTGKLMKGSGFGVIGDIVVGIIGAFIGGFIMRALGFAGQGGLIYTIIVAIIGAVLLTLLLRLVTGNRGSNV